ncbi:MAG: LptF/LptG family permease [Ignavibacteriales bacterium]|nr:LptF/LptG family permease [Ignavibacteriales bacterium]
MILSFYVMRKFFIPFLFSVFSLFSIFILQFLMRFSEQLIGKGIATTLIIQLIVYNLAWMMVLVVPMAVLVATLMAFGGLSQNNEITAIRAAGLSIYKLTILPLILAAGLVYFLIYFNNEILPDANHKTKKSYVGDYGNPSGSFNCTKCFYDRDIRLCDSCRKSDTRFKQTDECKNL